MKTSEPGRSWSPVGGGVPGGLVYGATDRNGAFLVAERFRQDLMPLKQFLALLARTAQRER